MTLNANTCYKNEYKSNDNHNTIYKLSHNHANNPSEPLSVNEKILIQIWASQTALQMTK